jgi:uncharacterized repeat protein (TIGR03803 family)
LLRRVFDEDIPMKKSLLTLAFALACAAFTFSLAVRAQAQTLTYLGAFNGTDGQEPNGPLVLGTDGNFYGSAPVTLNSSGQEVAGLIFDVTPSGKISAFYNFCDGCYMNPYPHSSPVLAADGNFYGLVGDVFYRLTADGQFTVLYTFCTDVGCPAADALILGNDGNFYGASAGGGKNQQGDIVKITPSGVLTVLHSFCSLSNCSDGYSANPRLFQASNGNLYGTTDNGGTLGGGVLYEITPSGSYTVIRSYCNANDGNCPNGSFPSSILEDASGNLFGTTLAGGKYGAGTFFKITSNNQYTIVHNFQRPALSAPGNLMLASDGNFYGIGQKTGSGSGGTLFEITPAGFATPFYTFVCCGSNKSLGNGPQGPLLQSTDGNLYGVTAGGSRGDTDGTIFKLSTSLGPLAETVPTGGKVGTSVLIVGKGLIGTSSVKFNGVAATFTVESDTYIRATVPAGATTGKVSVVTSSGTLNSNPRFVVTK